MTKQRDGKSGGRRAQRRSAALWTILGTVATIAISSAVVVGFFPLVFGWGLAFLLAWLGIVMGFRAVWHRFRAQDSNPPGLKG